MHGKGQTGESFAKHIEMRRLAWGQSAIAAHAPRVLRPGASVGIIDLNAADGKGVPNGNQAQPFLPLGHDFDDTSQPTPLVAAKAALIFAQQGFDARVLLCERSRPLREELKAALPGVREQMQWRGPCEILANNSSLLKRPLDFDYALVISDPNGPSDTPIDVLMHVARSSAKSDFIILVNETGAVRPAGLPDLPHTRAAREAGIRYLEYLEPEFWLRTLGKRYVVERTAPLVSRGMNGKLFLVTNYYGQRPPHGYEVSERTAATVD